ARGVGLGIATSRALKGASLRRKLRVVEICDFAPRAALTLFYSDALGPLAVAVDTFSASLTAELLANA
ncbi:MAG TPA: hypothetical protein VK629_15410, partial [Steroidobacteraceae bacterium]|nr:hypothetical protein [Steroidobacteraceae bacterium]